MTQRKQIKKRKAKKRGRGIPYIYKNRIYFGKKTTNRNRSSFKSYCTSFRKRWKHYQSLMVKRKYVQRINFKKLIKKEKKKNEKHGRVFGDVFKFLYSLGKQWRNSMQ